MHPNLKSTLIIGAIILLLIGISVGLYFLITHLTKRTPTSTSTSKIAIVGSSGDQSQNVVVVKEDDVVPEDEKEEVPNFRNGRYFDCVDDNNMYGYVIKDGYKREIPDYETLLSIPIGIPTILHTERVCNALKDLPDGEVMKKTALPQGSCPPFNKNGGYIGRCTTSGNVYYIQNCRKVLLDNDEVKYFNKTNDPLSKFNVDCGTLARIGNM